MADYNRNQRGAYRTSNQDWNENRGRGRNEDDERFFGPENRGYGTAAMNLIKAMPVGKAVMNVTAKIMAVAICIAQPGMVAIMKVILILETMQATGTMDIHRIMERA